MNVVLDSGGIFALLGILGVLIVQAAVFGTMWGSMRTRVTVMEKFIEEGRLVLARLATIEANVETMTKTLDRLMRLEETRK